MEPLEVTKSEGRAIPTDSVQILLVNYALTPGDFCVAPRQRVQSCVFFILHN